MVWGPKTVEHPTISFYWETAGIDKSKLWYESLVIVITMLLRKLVTAATAAATSPATPGMHIANLKRTYSSWDPIVCFEEN